MTITSSLHNCYKTDLFNFSGDDFHSVREFVGFHKLGTVRGHVAGFYSIHLPGASLEGKERENTCRERGLER